MSIIGDDGGQAGTGEDLGVWNHVLTLYTQQFSEAGHASVVQLPGMAFWFRIRSPEQ